VLCGPLLEEGGVLVCRCVSQLCEVGLFGDFREYVSEPLHV